MKKHWMPIFALFCSILVSGCQTQHNPNYPPRLKSLEGDVIFFEHNMYSSAKFDIIKKVRIEKSSLWINKEKHPISTIEMDEINNFFNCIFYDLGMQASHIADDYKIISHEQDGVKRKWEIRASTHCALPNVIYAATLSKKYPEIMQNKQWRAKDIRYSYPVNEDTGPRSIFP